MDLGFADGTLATWRGFVLGLRSSFTVSLADWMMFRGVLSMRTQKSGLFFLTCFRDLVTAGMFALC